MKEVLTNCNRKVTNGTVQPLTPKLKIWQLESQQIDLNSVVNSNSKTQILKERQV